MLDIALLSLLVVIVPAQALWKSLTERDRAPEPRSLKYGRSLVKVLGLLALLSADWIVNQRTAAALGLSMPPSMAGWIGLAIAIVALATVGTMSRLKSPSQATEEATRSILPQSPKERQLFLVFTLVIGSGWELLYRGYLLWVLEPRIGTIAAVILAAAAYGVAHGYKDARMFAGSLVAAFVFMIGYALTRSLWWLMLLHTGLPLIGAFVSKADRGR